MIGAKGKLTDQGLRLRVLESDYSTQELFSGDTVMSIPMAERVAVVRDDPFLTILNLTQDAAGYRERRICVDNHEVFFSV